MTAARTLVDAGHQVVVFEKTAGPGGRLATRVVRNVEKSRGTADLAFDHGAQYFTVRDPRFAATVEQWQRDRLVATWTPRIVGFDGDGWEEVATGVDRYVGVPGMAAIANALARPLDVRYSTAVDSLEPLTREFDRVIVAVPCAQAKALVTGPNHPRSRTPWRVTRKRRSAAVSPARSTETRTPARTRCRRMI